MRIRSQLTVVSLAILSLWRARLDVYGAVAAVCCFLFAETASAYAVGPAVPLESLAQRADLVVKATAIADRVVSDEWFEERGGFEVRETEFRLVSVIKGAPSTQVMKFRHYAPVGDPFAPPFRPQYYRFEPNRTYLVFASHVTGDKYRQLDKHHTMKADQGAMLTAHDRSHRGSTVTEVSWAELMDLLAGSNPDDIVYAIAQLDQMSGGGYETPFEMQRLDDFDRGTVLEAIAPFVLAENESVATKAIAAFGQDQPFMNDGDAEYWLAGIGNGGEALGVGPRMLAARPDARAAANELIAVADSTRPAVLRAKAIRALGRLAPAGKPLAWSADAAEPVRAAAVLVSAAQPDRTAIARGAADPAPDVRRAAAIAVGYSQDELLLPILEMLLADAEANVRDHAARSLLSFGNRAQPLLENHVSSPYRTIFVNTLARQNPAQYLTELATIIERDGAAGEFGSIVPSGEVAIGGRVLASESWSILFDYVRHRPSSELADGTLERWLDALEKLRWRSSSEPQRLYALYMNHGLNDRAARFREAVTRSARFDMEPIFDRVDRNPAMFLH